LIGLEDWLAEQAELLEIVAEMYLYLIRGMIKAIIKKFIEIIAFIREDLANATQRSNHLRSLQN
jgi:hypothetical protein